jgi:alkyl hydroperoxide reductase subunit AhpC
MDTNGEITERYAARRDLIGGTVRTVYIIDKGGKIQFAQRGTPSDEELLARLKVLG